MMKNFKLFAAVAAMLLLSGCGFVKGKAAGYYLSKARATAQKAGPAPAELEEAFARVEKASGYAPDSPAAVDVLDDLAAASEKSAFAKGQELQSAILKKMIARNGAYWPARESLVSFLASRGDLSGLADEAMAAGKLASDSDKDPGNRYCALLVQLAATAASVPWLESEAFVSLNKSPEVFFEKAGGYSAAAEQVSAIKAELDRMTAADAALKKVPPPKLASAAEVACADALRDKDAIARAAAFNAKAAAEPAFRNAVTMTIQGNAALVGKDYARARAFYQGALSRYPGLLDSRRQLAETDFQEGASLAAVGGAAKAADQLLGRAYAGANAVIAAAGQAANSIPFLKPDKFIGDTYALKAASIAAIRAVKGAKLKKAAAARLEADFKASLDEALKFNPEGRLARELNERYTKEGF